METSAPSAPQPILGLDNVRIDLPIAGVGSRVAAGLIDYLALAGLMLAWWLLGMLAISWLDFRGWFWAVFGLGSFALQWGYFAVLEIVMGGQTPGKHLVGVRVVSRRGGRASPWALVVRSLLRTVDLFTAVPMMAIDARSRRLGDWLGGTLVVHDLPPPAEEIRIGRLPAGWRSRHAALVEGFLQRAERLDRGAAQDLAARLLALIARDDPALGAEIPPLEDRVLALMDVLHVRTG